MTARKPARTTRRRRREPTMIVVHSPRPRTRELLRGAVPRRMAHLAITRSTGMLERRLRATLVDAVVVDLGAADDVVDAAALARAFPSVAFLAVTPFRPVDAPLIAMCAEHGLADVLADGVDDAFVRHALAVHGFSARFAAALAEPPAALRLTSPLQRRVWAGIVSRGGRAVRTRELASALSVTREHLSRAFAAGALASLKRVIDFVRVLAAGELAKNPGYDVRDVAHVLGFASPSHLSATSQRLVGRPARSLSRLRAVDLVESFVGRSRGTGSG